MDNMSQTPIPETPKPQKTPSLSTIISMSIAVGAIAGGLVGGVVAKGGVAGFLNKSTASASGSSITKSTVSVQEDNSTIDVVKKTSPAVVSIVAKKDYSKAVNDDPNNFFFPFLQQQQPQGIQPVGSGSGFIVSKDGIILTNKHVATIQGDSFVVIMNDGTTHDATVLATDPSTDIALMKIDGKDLPTIELGDSDAVETGQNVIAIGNVLGKYQNSVTKGIVSGLSRSIQAGDGSGSAETLSNVIQTDAAINHGNSGGPLLNSVGQAIGINTAIDSEGQLVGFAIPINVAKKDIDSFQSKGKIERAYLGVRYSIVNQEVKDANKLSVDYGALVVKGATAKDLAVIPGSPADKVGIVENDIILEVNGKKITEDNDLAQALLDKSVGDTVKLKILSKGNEKTVDVKLEARPSS